MLDIPMQSSLSLDAERAKQETDIILYACCVLARENKSGIQAGIWANRLGAVNRERGPLFQTKKGHRSKFVDFERGVYIPIHTAFTARCEEARVQTEAVKNRVAQDIIELNNEALSGNEGPRHGDQVDIDRAMAIFESDVGAQLPRLLWLCSLRPASEKEFRIGFKDWNRER
jgi:hypothetical protein